MSFVSIAAICVFAYIQLSIALYVGLGTSELSKIMWLVCGWTFLTCIIVLFLITLKKQKRTIYIASFAAELLLTIISLFHVSSLPIELLIGSAVAVGIGWLIKGKPIIMNLIVLVLVVILSTIITYLLMGEMRLGTNGQMLGIVQPFCLFMQVASLEKSHIDFKTLLSSNDQHNDVNPSTYSYLEQYKMQKRKGSNKNV